MCTEYGILNSDNGMQIRLNTCFYSSIPIAWIVEWLDGSMNRLFGDLAVLHYCYCTVQYYRLHYTVLRSEIVDRAVLL